MERLTEKRQGQNVIPLRQMSLEKAPLFALVKISDNTSFLYGDAANKLAAYEDTGITPEEIKALVERNSAKKVDEDECCPICHTYGKDDEGVQGEFCPNCGQRLDWGDDNA